MLAGVRRPVGRVMAAALPSPAAEERADVYARVTEHVSARRCVAYGLT